MTLREEILSNPLCEDAVAAKDCWEIARIISQGRKHLTSRYIGQGTVLDVMVQGGEFMDALVHVGTERRDVYWAIDLLRSGRFDIGTAKAQGQLDALVVALPSFAGDIASIKAIGYSDAPVTAVEVANALFNDDGSVRE